MSSLAQLADLTHDTSLLDRVKVFYDNGLWDMRPVGISRSANDYMVISNPGVNRWITFDFQPPEFDMTLTWRTTETRGRFRGDQVIAMVNFGTDLTFFDPID